MKRIEPGNTSREAGSGEGGARGRILFLAALLSSQNSAMHTVWAPEGHTEPKCESTAVSIVLHLGLAPMDKHLTDKSIHCRQETSIRFRQEKKLAD